MAGTTASSREKPTLGLAEALERVTRSSPLRLATVYPPLRSIRALSFSAHRHTHSLWSLL